MVESQNPNVSQVINPQQVVDLPLNGRQPTDLIPLSGAAVTAVSTNTSSSIGSTALMAPWTIPAQCLIPLPEACPTPPTTTSMAASTSTTGTTSGYPCPFPDALSEFSLNTSAMPANLGVHPGGSVNAVTRSGGNRFHGNVFEFVRNGVMDATARTYALTEGGIATPGVRDTLVRNQFGGTIGGPIKKDKLFFFGGYQGTMQNSTLGVSTTTIPTPAMITTGNLTALAAGNTNGCAVQTVNSVIHHGARQQRDQAVVAHHFLGHAHAELLLPIHPLRRLLRCMRRLSLHGVAQLLLRRSVRWPYRLAAHRVRQHLWLVFHGELQQPFLHGSWEHSVQQWRRSR